MKLAKVRYIHVNEIVEGILFETIDDVKILEPELQKSEIGVLKKFVKSGESSDRLNHIISGFRPLESAIAQLAILKGTISNTKAIYNLGLASESYLNSLRFSIIKCGKVFMNPEGGLCPVEGSLEILEESEFKEFPNPPKYYIWEGSKVINLENDFELEREAVSYMEKRFKSFSSIKDMKTYNELDFKRVFSKFVAQGGEYVYVYTTGMDWEQMYVYSLAALQSGLNKFIFHFNAGMDKNINTFVEWLKERAEVELIK